MIDKLGKRITTKRKVDLVSSHSDLEDDNGPSMICATEEQDPSTATNMLRVYEIQSRSYDDGLPPHTLPLRARPGERIIYYEEYIPDPG